MKLLLLLLLALVLGNGLYHVFKPLPPGVSYEGAVQPAEDVEFLADHTWLDEEGNRQTDQAIFDRVFGIIREAEDLVVLDMFLFNDMQGPVAETHRPLSEQLTEVLLQRMEEKPELRVVFITDPFNHLYGGVRSRHLEALEEAGARVVYTDLTRLRDPNPAWSAIWRLCCRWLGNSTRGWLPNLVGEEPVTVRTYLDMLNFKANHRKTLVADSGDGWVGLVTSANPHDASSAHVNTGVVFRGPAALELLETEKAVMRFSGEEPRFELPEVETEEVATPQEGELGLQVITESRIRDAARAAIDAAGEGDRVDLAIFYFSHEELIQAVKRAADRGARVRVLLDPNRDAFGREKRGIPNRQTGRRLHDAGIDVRWAHTTGEQFHAKQLAVQYAGGSMELITGSSNFTRRNLDDYNLETNVRVVGSAEHPFMGEALAWFDSRWHNRPGKQVAQPFEAWEDRSRFRALQAWIGERLGFSSY